MTVGSEDACRLHIRDQQRETWETTMGKHASVTAGERARPSFDTRKQDHPADDAKTNPVARHPRLSSDTVISPPPSIHAHASAPSSIHDLHSNRNSMIQQAPPFISRHSSDSTRDGVRTPAKYRSTNVPDIDGLRRSLDIERVRASSRSPRHSLDSSRGA